MSVPATSPAIGERERTVVTRLRVADGALLGPVLCRVVSMVLARADWPLDRLEEALLVCDALCAQAGEQAGTQQPTFSVQADESHAELLVRGLQAQAAQRLLDHRLPLVGNVLERLAEAVSIQADEDGLGVCLTIALSAHRAE